MGILLGLFPVLLFLAALLYMDSYKLISLTAVLVTIGVGAGAALLALLLNTWLMGTLRVDWTLYARYCAPVIEELLKASFLLYLLKANKIGFPVDAAVRGFAIGAGFALVENLYYLHLRPDASPYLWVIRGFGTALMHGGATAIVGILSKETMDRLRKPRVVVILPGLLVAVILHSFFNHFLLNPLLSTVLVLVLLPIVILFVYRRSEQSTRDWLGVGFDSDQTLLEMITTGILSETKIGAYLHSVQDRFPGETVADMLCYLRLHLELSIQAKGMMIMREAGFEVPVDKDLKERFDELHYLERSIGKTGELALHPFLHNRRKDLWQITTLET
ncbi:MAG: PrsW family glutamic-type intramembrane protease [Bacteroidota bacterium]